jgi:hypothetical protein
VLHILNNKHKYGPKHTTVQLIKTHNKGWHINILEIFYFQQFQCQGSLIYEQSVGKINHLFALVHNTDTQDTGMQMIQAA